MCAAHQDSVNLRRSDQSRRNDAEEQAEAVRGDAWTMKVRSRSSLPYSPKTSEILRGRRRSRGSVSRRKIATLSRQAIPSPVTTQNVDRQLACTTRYPPTSGATTGETPI